MSFLQGIFGPPNIEELKKRKKVKGLIKALGYKKDATIRQAAAQALVEMDHAGYAVEVLSEVNDAQAVDPLIVILEGADKNAQGAAIEALDKLDWQPDKSEAGAVYWIAKRQWDKCVDISTHAVEPLIITLQDVDWEVRASVAEALGKIGDARAVEPLVNALKDKKWEVWSKARDALVQLGELSTEPLITALKDEDPELRRSATIVLWLIGDTRAIEPLIVCLHDTNSDVRASAAYALGVIRDARAVEPLIAALQDTDKSVRKTAAESLGEIGDLRAVEPLIVVLNDTNDSVRHTAARSLGKIGDLRAVEPLMDILNEIKVKPPVIQALGELGDVRAVEPLIALLKTREYRHWSIAEALGKIGDTRAVEPLYDIVRNWPRLRLLEESLWENAARALETITGQSFDAERHKARRRFENLRAKDEQERKELKEQRKREKELEKLYQKYRSPSELL